MISELASFADALSYITFILWTSVERRSKIEGAGNGTEGETADASSQWCVRSLARSLFARGTTLVWVRFGSFHHARVDVDGG